REWLNRAPCSRIGMRGSPCTVSNTVNVWVVVRMPQITQDVIERSILHQDDHHMLHPCNVGWHLRLHRQSDPESIRRRDVVGIQLPCLLRLHLGARQARTLPPTSETRRHDGNPFDVSTYRLRDARASESCTVCPRNNATLGGDH